MILNHLNSSFPLWFLDLIPSGNLRLQVLADAFYRIALRVHCKHSQFGSFEDIC